MHTIVKSNSESSVSLCAPLVALYKSR